MIDHTNTLPLRLSQGENVRHNRKSLRLRREMKRWKRWMRRCYRHDPAAHCKPGRCQVLGGEAVRMHCPKCGNWPTLARIAGTTDWIWATTDDAGYILDGGPSCPSGGARWFHFRQIGGAQ